MANRLTSGPHCYLGEGGWPTVPKDLYDPQRTASGSHFAEARSDHWVSEELHHQKRAWRGPLRACPLDACEGAQSYQSRASYSLNSFSPEAPHSSRPWKWRHESNQQYMPLPSSHPYTRGASGTKSRNRLPHLRERKFSGVNAEEPYDQEVPEAESRKPQQGSQNAGHRQSPHQRNQLDVSCTTTRSNSGSRRDSQPYGEVQVQSMSSCSNAPVSASPTDVLHRSQPKERDDKISTIVPEATATAAATVDDVAAQAAADISEMTEAEVRVYALQMQTLTQVLIRNMRCLYSTARAEIDRKDQRLAVQEGEITSLKRLLALSHNGS